MARGSAYACLISVQYRKIVLFYPVVPSARLQLKVCFHGFLPAALKACFHGFLPPLQLPTQLMEGVFSLFSSSSSAFNASCMQTCCFEDVHVNSIVNVSRCQSITTPSIIFSFPCRTVAVSHAPPRTAARPGGRGGRRPTTARRARTGRCRAAGGARAESGARTRSRRRGARGGAAGGALVGIGVRGDAPSTTCARTRPSPADGIQ